VEERKDKEEGRKEDPYLLQKLKVTVVAPLRKRAKNAANEKEMKKESKR